MSPNIFLHQFFENSLRKTIVFLIKKNIIHLSQHLHIALAQIACLYFSIRVSVTYYATNPETGSALPNIRGTLCLERSLSTLAEAPCF